MTTLFWKRELMCERRKIMQNSNVDWITTKELAEIKGISERAVRKSIAKNKYVIRVLTILKLAWGLKGNKLKEFLNKLGEKHHKYKISYIIQLFLLYISSKYSLIYYYFHSQ